MADIKEIDYDQIINGASKIASFANEMQNSVKEALQKIETMSNDWFGYTYDNFIELVNETIPDLNKLFEKAVSDIPHEIVAKAKSYAAVNQSSCGTSFNEQTTLILKELPKTNKGAKIRFRSSEVSSHQSSIVSKLEQAKSNAKQATDVCRTLESDWQSISGEKNIRELIRAFGNVSFIISTYSTTLDKLIRQQATSIEAIETVAEIAKSVNELPEKTADLIEDLGTKLENKIVETIDQTWMNLTGKN